MTFTPQSSESSRFLELDFSSDTLTSALNALTPEEETQTKPIHDFKINPETVEQDLARLVLTLIEFLRRLMELQAIRRMDSGSLSAEDEEKLGMTLYRAKCQIAHLADQFGLKIEDLNLDLGPLGSLMK